MASSLAVVYWRLLRLFRLGQESQGLLQILG